VESSETSEPAQKLSIMTPGRVPLASWRYSAYAPTHGFPRRGLSNRANGHGMQALVDSEDGRGQGMRAVQDFRKAIGDPGIHVLERDPTNGTPQALRLGDKAT